MKGSAHSKLHVVGPNDTIVAVYQWTPDKAAAAILLAEGYTNQEVADKTGKGVRTIYRWQNDIEFSVEVDRLSLMVGIASKAERLRIARRVIRQKINQDSMSEKDVLDWLKFVQSETDGAKLELTNLLTSITNNDSSVADGGQGRDHIAKTG